MTGKEAFQVLIDRLQKEHDDVVPIAVVGHEAKLNRNQEGYRAGMRDAIRLARDEMRRLTS